MTSISREVARERQAKGNARARARAFPTPVTALPPVSPPRSLKAPVVCLVMETLLAGYCSVSLRLSLRLVGTLTSNDDHGNENVKKAIGLITKTTIFHLHHAFLYISLPSLHDYDMKMPNFKFYRGSTQATTKFPLSLSELGYGP